MPDDPVALYIEQHRIANPSFGAPSYSPKALRALARHYEARGMRKAAEMIKYRGKCAVAMINAEERIDEKKAYAWDATHHSIAIFSAAAELERKP